MEVTISRRIDFCDVDLTGVMWHGNYCKYYEAARCELLKNLGFSYKKIQEYKHQIPLVCLKIKYSKACRYDQQIDITAKLIRFNHFLEFTYVIKDALTGELLSSAETKHVFYDSQKQRALVSAPEFIKEKLAKVSI